MNTFVIINMSGIKKTKTKTLVIWESHIMYPDWNHLPVFPYLSPHNLPHEKDKSILDLEHSQIPSSQPPKEDESFSACIRSRSQKLRKALQVVRMR